MVVVRLSLVVRLQGHVSAVIGVGSTSSASSLIVVFDVETDGGSPKQRCIEMGFVVLESVSFQEVHSFSKYWRLPPGRRINPYSQEKHGITLDTLSRFGVDPYEGLCEFLDWVDRAKASGVDARVVAHNAAFDAKTVQNMLEVCNIPRAFTKDECFCTMRASTPHAGLLDKKGKRKPPGNEELYRLFHGSPPKWARLHSALDDARVTAMNYRTGRERGWW